MKIQCGKPHVLVVADDHSTCEIVGFLFENRDYVVSKASNDVEALALLELTTVNLVILDVDLGNDKGVDLLQSIKAVSPSVHVMVLTTASNEKPSWEIAQANGAQSKLCKTHPPSRLLNEVDRCLHIRKTAARKNSTSRTRRAKTPVKRSVRTRR